MVRHAIAAAAALIVIAGVAVDAAETSIRLGMQLEPPHLDPTAGAAAAIDEVVYANVFEGLTRIDRDGAAAPALASKWTVSDGGLVYTFTLREGITFHDGTAMDAADVVFSLERAMAEGSVNAQPSLFAPIKAVEAAGSHAVRITLLHPYAALPFNLAWGDAVIVAPETAAENKSNPVGTGPFRFERWVKGDRVELVRNEDYWGTPVRLERATFQFISDPAAAAAAMLAGDLDAFPNFPAPETLPEFKADPRFRVAVGATEGETILAINNAKPPFDDVLVRRAIAHAIDRDAIIAGAMFGYGAPIGSHFSPLHPAYLDLTGLYPHDVERAKALLTEAGLGDGFAATLKLPPPAYARRSGEIIAAQLKAVGIEVELVPIEWPQWLEQVFSGKDFELTIIAHTEPLDIGIYARNDYYFGYRSEAFDTLWAEIEAERDDEARDRLLGDAQRMLAEDAVNGFLFQLPKLGVWDARIDGLWENSPVQANDLTGAYWRE